MLTLIGGWAESLTRGLFSGFIGPLWPVFESPAKEAVVAFFNLARRGDLTLAEALLQVRAEHGRSSPSFLAFIYYGDVMARFPAPSPSTRQPSRVRVASN